jgi:hypothetical protein
MDDPNRESRARSVPDAYRVTTAFLRAALPPSNISADLVRIQAAMFGGLDQPSARALPPLVPFGWTDGPEDVEEVSDSVLPRGLKCTEYDLVGSSLVLTVEWRRKARRPFSADFRYAGDLLFPAGSYIVIAPLEGECHLEGRTLENVPSGRRLSLPEPPSGTARVYRLASVELSWQMSDHGLEYLRYEVLSERWISERAG